MKRLYVLSACILIAIFIDAQNLIPSNAWVVGSGTSGVFNTWGEQIENERVSMTSPYGSQGVVWKSANSDLVPNDAPGNCDGGWVTSEIPVDHTKNYRFIVWMKKDNSTEGNSYFGCGYWGQNHVVKLDESATTNPYFFAGDLPELDTWYLMVGYVMNSSYSETTSIGALYNGETFEKVATLQDFKFLSTTTAIRQRVFSFYDIDLTGIQYYYAPRMEVVDNNAPSIETLLRYDLTNIGYFNKVYYAYDDSGNREERHLGYETMTRSATVAQLTNTTSNYVSNEEPHVIETALSDELTVKIYPNPTEGVMKLEIDGTNHFDDSGYVIYDTQGKMLRQATTLSSVQEIDITELPEGNYVLSLRLNGQLSQWKIIKK